VERSSVSENRTNIASVETNVTKTPSTNNACGQTEARSPEEKGRKNRAHVAARANNANHRDINSHLRRPT
jgi:hypothetical protein